MSCARKDCAKKKRGKYLYYHPVKTHYFITLFPGGYQIVFELIEDLKTHMLDLVIVYKKTVEALQTYHGRNDALEHCAVFAIV